MIPARRLRAHAALFAALLGVAALLSGLGVGLVGHLGSAALDGTRTALAQLRGGQGELVFDAPKGDDPAAQDARARRIIADALRRGGASVPVTVTRADGSNGVDSVWTVRPIAARATPADLPTLAAARTRIRDAMLADTTVNVRGVAVSGKLDDQARSLAARIAPLSAIEPVPLLLVAAIGVVALAELARLLDGVRMRETALLRSRGASASHIGWSTAAEAALVSGTGALAGGGIADGALALSGEHAVDPALGAGIVAAVVAVSVALVGGAAYRSARTAFRRDTADDSGRARRLATPGLLVLLTAAAAVSMWRFLQFGSPLAPTATGARLDPIAVLAPALGLADLALLWLALFPLAARAAEAVAARRTDAEPVLIARQLARRARLIASPVVLIALAGGGLVVAGCYTPSWQHAQARTAGLHAGADLVVTGGPAAETLATTSHVPGVRAAAPVVQFGWTTDAGDPVRLTALAGRGIHSVVSTADGTLDRDRLATALTAPVLGARLPDAASALTATTRPAGLASGLTALVMDDEGVASSITLTAGAHGTVRGALPSGRGRVLLGVSVTIPPAPESGPVDCEGESCRYIAPPQTTVSLHLDGLATRTSDGASTPLELGPGGWDAVASYGNGAAVDGFAPDGALGFTGAIGSDQPVTVRMQPGGTQTVPIAVSAAFARAAAVHPGQSLDLRLDSGPGGTLTARIAAIEPELPGAAGEESVLAPLPALQAQRARAGYDPPLAPSAVWAATDDPDASAVALARALPGAVVTGPAIDPGTRVLAAVPVALWLGMAGGAVLALIALAAVAGELLRLRSDETGVLRALGLTRRRIAGLRRLELAAAAFAALIGAAVAGVLVAGLTVPGLVGATLDEPFVALPPVLRGDPLGLAAAGIALAALIAAIVLGYGRRVGAQARTALAKEANG